MQGLIWSPWTKSGSASSAQNPWGKGGSASVAQSPWTKKGVFQELSLVEVKLCLRMWMKKVKDLEL